MEPIETLFRFVIESMVSASNATPTIRDTNNQMLDHVKDYTNWQITNIQQDDSGMLYFDVSHPNYNNWDQSIMFTEKHITFWREGTISRQLDISSNIKYFIDMGLCSEESILTWLKEMEFFNV